MKTVKGMTWKERKYDYMFTKYQPFLSKCVGFNDDRRVFINTYNMLMEAIASLDDEPNNFVAVAMNTAMQEEYSMLDRIMKRFS